MSWLWRPPESWPDDHHASVKSDRELLGMALFVLVVGLLLQVTPDRQGVHLFGHVMPESCPLRAWAGMTCPGCGLTRSFILGLRLDPEAFALHRIGPPFLAIVMFQIPYRAWRLRRSRRLAEEGLIDLELDRGLWLGRIIRTGLIIALLGSWIFDVVQGRATI